MRHRQKLDPARGLVRKIRAQVLTVEVVTEMVNMAARADREATSDHLVRQFGAEWEAEWRSRAAAANTSTTAASA